MPPGPYRATTCRGEGIKLWITDILFWPHKNMESLHGWVISPMPGPPPRQHKLERQYTPSIHPFIPTRRIWNDDYSGQMIFGDLVGLKFPDICLTGEEKTRKTSPRKPVPTGDRTRARACYHLLHSGGHKWIKCYECYFSHELWILERIKVWIKCFNMLTKNWITALV